jgi:hypothetical protein
MWATNTDPETPGKGVTTDGEIPFIRFPSASFAEETR